MSIVVRTLVDVLLLLALAAGAGAAALTTALAGHLASHVLELVHVYRVWAIRDIFNMGVFRVREWKEGGKDTMGCFQDAVVVKVLTYLALATSCYQPCQLSSQLFQAGDLVCPSHSSPAPPCPASIA